MAKGFDPGLLAPADLEVTIDTAAAIASMATTIKSMAAARAAQTGSWKDKGFRSAAEELARRTGTPMGEARDAIDTGNRLVELPEVAKAALAGELSPGQASIIADAAEADPTAVPKLLDQAANGSFTELKNEAAKVKAAKIDLEERHRRIHSRRTLRPWIDTDGGWHLSAYGTPERGAEIMAALTPISDTHFQNARKEGRREPPEAYMFDALVTLAKEFSSQDPDPDPGTDPDLYDAGTGTNTDTGTDTDTDPDADADTDPDPDSDTDPDPDSIPDTDIDRDTDPDSDADPDSDTEAAFPDSVLFDDPDDPFPDTPLFSESPDPPPRHHDPPSQRKSRRARRRWGAPAKILVRIDYLALLRGVSLPGETCELVGYGAVPVSVVEGLLSMNDPFIGAILAKGRELVGVTHLGRQPTRYQQSALEWLYPTCAADGCSAVARLQRDHRVDWSKTHTTVFDLLDLLCAHHHKLKTQNNWALVAGYGKRKFVPPSDPRHPDYKPASLSRDDTIASSPTPSGPGGSRL